MKDFVSMLVEKYISYTEEKPITMNPFRIKREELNVEKQDSWRIWILLIWKGSQGNHQQNWR